MIIKGVYAINSCDESLKVIIFNAMVGTEPTPLDLSSQSGTFEHLDNSKMLGLKSVVQPLGSQKNCPTKSAVTQVQLSLL